MKPLILLGAGASVDAGIPTAFDMTHEMINLFQKNYYQYYMEGYKVAIKILRFVAGGLQFKRGIGGKDPFQGINIEDLFTAIMMLAKRHELEIVPFVSQWSPYIDDFEKLQPDYPDFGELQESLQELGNAARHLSKNSLPRDPDPRHAAGNVVKELQKIINKNTECPSSNVFETTNELMIKTLVEMVWLTDKGNIDYLVPLIQQANADVITVASLNYDNAIELAAESLGVPVNTGIDYWSQTGLFKKAEIGIDLLKLHGSIDWSLQQNVKTKEALLPHDVVKRIPKERVGKTINMPAIIFGAGNKLTARGPFLELFKAFQNRLEDYDELLVIGYSFRDQHINEVIYGWLNRSQNKKIVIIDSDRVQKHENIFCNSFGPVLSDRCKLLNLGARSGIKAYFGTQEEPSEGIV